MAYLKILLLFVATSCTQVIVNRHTKAQIKWPLFTFAEDILNAFSGMKIVGDFYSNFMEISS